MFAAIRDDFLSSLLGSEADEDAIKKKALETIDEMLSAKEIEMVTNTIELDMTKNGESWKIDLKTSLIGSFMGSLEDFLD